MQRRPQPGARARIGTPHPPPPASQACRDLQLEDGGHSPSREQIRICDEMPGRHPGGPVLPKPNRSESFGSEDLAGRLGGAYDDVIEYRAKDVALLLDGHRRPPRP